MAEEKENLNPKMLTEKIASKQNQGISNKEIISSTEILSKKLPCRMCDETFEWKYELLQHIKKNHKNTDSERQKNSEKEELSEYEKLRLKNIADRQTKFVQLNIGSKSSGGKQEEKNRLKGEHDFERLHVLPCVLPQPENHRESSEPSDCFSP